MGGPVWNAPIHSSAFITEVLANIPQNLATKNRIKGVLTVIKEELQDVPLYYTLEMLSGTLHVEMPKILEIRSAILNAGYDVSFTHMHRTSIKTNAPSKFVWDVMRKWEKLHPINQKRLVENSPVINILNKPITFEISFKMNPKANPESKKLGLMRFQQNPLPNWGPGIRATAMVGEQTDKRKRNQGKRKRDEEEGQNKK